MSFKRNPQMQIAHIVPIDIVLGGFRQPVEMYLAHQILAADKVKKYEALGEMNRREQEIMLEYAPKRVIMVDNSAYELTYLQNKPPLEMKQVIEAAQLVGATELVLRDWPGDGAKSLALTFESLNEAEKAGWKGGLVGIVAGKTFEEWLNNYMILAAVPQITTIGIPKYLAAMGKAPYCGRTEFMQLVGGAFAEKQIHFFGCTYGLIELMGLTLQYSPRSMDTSWFAHNANKGNPIWQLRTDKEKELNLDIVLKASAVQEAAAEIDQWIKEHVI